MAITSQTPANLVVGAGDVLADGADFGATTGDNVFRIEQDIFTPELNGAPGALVGTHYKTREVAILEVTVPEVSEDTVVLQWPGVHEVPPNTFESDGLTRRIPTGDYHDYELRVPGLPGISFSFFADDGLNQANVEYSAQNAGLMAPRLEIHSNWDPALLAGTWPSPHRIVITGAGS